MIDIGKRKLTTGFLFWLYDKKVKKWLTFKNRYGSISIVSSKDALNEYRGVAQLG